jgi:uncharacterized protein
VIVDSGVLGKIRPAPGGGLIVPARIGRAGVQLYKRPDGTTVRAYRPAEEVSKADFTGAPITIGHPAGGVSPSTWGKLAKGSVREQQKDLSVVDGVAWAQADLQINAADALQGVVNRTLTECSCAYDCTRDWTPGVTTDGESYDVVFRDYVPNHVAFGGNGFARAGRDARVLISDGENMNDSLSDTCFVADAADPPAAPAQDVTALVKLVADGNAEVARLKAENEQLTAKVAAADAATAAAQAALPKQIADGVASELAFRAKVSPHLPKDFVFDGKSRREVQAAVIGKLDPKFVVSDSVTDIYLDAYIEAAAKYSATATHDFNHDNLGGAAPATSDAAKHIADSTKNLWKGEPETASLTSQLSAAIAALGSK